DAADKIARSKTFDNATSCSSENSVIVLDAVHDALVAALAQHGARVLDRAEATKLERAMFPDGKLAAAYIAQAAPAIAARAGLTRPELADARILVVPQDAGAVGKDHPFSGEKLSPVLALYRVADFAAAAELA